MLERISELMKEGADFAFETTLSTRSYQSLVQKSQTFGYTVTLLYFWLESPDLAIQRVKKRVSMGGYHKDNISTLPFAERVRLGVQKALRKLAWVFRSDDASDFGQTVPLKRSYNYIKKL